MGENKEPLPVCKLCGSPAHTWAAQWSYPAQCSGRGCIMSHVVMTQDQWRTLMAPPVVNDAMVERADTAMDTHVQDIRGISPYYKKRAIRAVLEAALRE